MESRNNENIKIFLTEMEARDGAELCEQQNRRKKLKDLRNKNGLTQQELADRAELTKGYISQLERGQVAPSVVTLLDLIECLGTTPSEFFQRDGRGTCRIFRRCFF